MNFTDKQLSTLEVFILTSVVQRYIARHAEQHFNLHKMPIPYHHYGILRMLSHQEQTLSEISRMLMLDPSTLVSPIDSLVSKGFIKRGTDPNDRRRTPLSLTDEGKALLKKMPPPQGDDISNSLNKLGEEKRTQLITLLREVIHNMPDGESVLKDIDARIATHRTNLPNHCK